MGVIHLCGSYLPLQFSRADLLLLRLCVATLLLVPLTPVCLGGIQRSGEGRLAHADPLYA